MLGRVGEQSGSSRGAVGEQSGTVGGPSWDLQNHLNNKTQIILGRTAKTFKNLRNPYDLGQNCQNTLKLTKP